MDSPCISAPQHPRIPWRASPGGGHHSHSLLGQLGPSGRERADLKPAGWFEGNVAERFSKGTAGVSLGVFFSHILAPPLTSFLCVARGAGGTGRLCCLKLSDLVWLTIRFQLPVGLDEVCSSPSSLPHLSHHHRPLLLSQEPGELPSAQSSLPVFLRVGEVAVGLGGGRMLCPFC